MTYKMKRVSVVVVVGAGGYSATFMSLVLSIRFHSSVPVIVIIRSAVSVQFLSVYVDIKLPLKLHNVCSEAAVTL